MVNQRQQRTRSMKPRKWWRRVRWQHLVFEPPAFRHGEVQISEHKAPLKWLYHIHVYDEKIDREALQLFKTGKDGYKQLVPEDQIPDETFFGKASKKFSI